MWHIEACVPDTWELHTISFAGQMEPYATDVLI